MCHKKIFLFLLSFGVFINTVFAQYDAPLYTTYTTDAARAKMYERLTNYSITKNLSGPLNDSTEENWEDAFSAIEVLLYRTPFTNEKIHFAFNHISERSVDFQKSLLSLAYSDYPNVFSSQVADLLHITTDSKVFALCAEYLLQHRKARSLQDSIVNLITQNFGDQGIIDPVLYMLQLHITELAKESFLPKKNLQELFDKKFLPGQTIMYSIQRHNRDYPGLLVIRNQAGNFITDETGNVFHIPQLARSVTDLPFYLRLGNTPQGIFLMHGFGVSMSNFIGPTANVQLIMPVEAGIKSFLADSSIFDTVWTIDYYKRLIPPDLQNYMPLYHSYYAGLIGRSEIIAHGTTLDPKLYSDKPYYPLTPSQGCLCTREVWNGKRLESDQQKLINALLKAGGANGYCVVIELDDRQSAVTLSDILPLLTGK